MTTPIRCIYATDRQRFPADPTPDPEPVYELWHRTTAGSAVSCGFVRRGDGFAMIDAGRELMRGHEILRQQGAESPDVSYHLVLAGSYEGLPQPNLSRTSRIDRGRTLSEMCPT